MKGFDAWLTTDRMAESAEREADRLIALWEEFVATQVEHGDELLNANELDHPDHAIYTAWLALQVAIDERQYRLEAEAEAAAYREGEDLDREYDDEVPEGITLPAPTAADVAHLLKQQIEQEEGER